MPHGFSWAGVVVIVLLILILWGIRYGSIIAPQVRSTANKVADLNNLQKVDIKFKFPCGFTGSL